MTIQSVDDDIAAGQQRQIDAIWVFFGTGLVFIMQLGKAKPLD